MNIIKTRILQSQFELIRDRIGAILADEFEFQKSFGDTDFSKLVVWVSRTIPFDKAADMPSINVNFIHSDFYSKDASADTNIYKYTIDCQASGKSRQDGTQGDQTAMMRTQKIMGIARSILMNTQYRTLGFAAPSIQSRWIETMDIAEAMRNDADSLQFSRIVLCIRINEDIDLLDPKVLQGYDTNVMLDLTNEGYYFKVNAYA